MSSTSSALERYFYRISKFDPAEPASTRAADWTSISDIGQTFEGRILTRRDYEQTEYKYLEAVRLMLASSGVRELAVSDVLWVGDATSTGGIHDRAVVDAEAAVALCRAQLREELSCHLEAANGFAVDTGFDLYIYVTSPVPLDDAVDTIRRMGLFVETGVRSPYFTK